MTARTQTRFEAFTGGMPATVPIAFGAAVVVMIAAAKLGGSSLFFFSPLIFATAGLLLLMNARRRGSIPSHTGVGAVLLLGSAAVVVFSGLFANSWVDSPAFWASIAVAVALAAPLSAGIAPTGVRKD